MKKHLLTSVLAAFGAASVFAALPAEYTPVEYLESSGVQEIQTDYMPYNASTVQADVEPLAVNNGTSIFGAGDSDDHFNTMLSYSGNNMSRQPVASATPAA